MQKIQKYPKTIGDYVKVNDYSLEKSSDSSEKGKASGNTVELNDALRNAVERVDVHSTNYTITNNKLIKIVGTDGNDYFISAMLWEKPKKPTFKVKFNSGTERTYSADTTVSGISVSTEDVFNVTLTAPNSGGKMYYFLGSTEDGTPKPTAESKGTEYSGQLHINATLNEEVQRVVIKAGFWYTDKMSDIITLQLELHRKIKVFLGYTPSNSNDMAYSSYGVVSATTNQIGHGTVSPTWNAIKKVNGSNVDARVDHLTFYEDTSGTDYSFKATQNGWISSDVTNGNNLQIRHLRPFEILEGTSNINTDIGSDYEPHKPFSIRFSGEGSYDTKGVLVIPKVHYNVVYSNPTRTNISDRTLSNIGDITNVSGNCNVSAWTIADAESVTETLNGTEYTSSYSWKGQSATKAIRCRNLPTPTITYNRTTDTHAKGSQVNSNNQWASGMTFSISAAAIKDSNNSNVASGLYYSSGSSVNVNTQYSSPFTISFTNSPSGGTIAANSVKAQRRVDTWTNSEIATAPPSNQVISKPHVYVGTYSYNDGNGGQTAKNYSSAQIDAIFTEWKNGGTLSGIVTDASKMNYVHAEKATISEIYNYPLTFVTGLNAPLIAFPKGWGEVKTITDGQQDYTKTFNKIECSINGLDYYVYYFNTLGSDNTLAFNIIFN